MFWKRRLRSASAVSQMDSPSLRSTLSSMNSPRTALSLTPPFARGTPSPVGAHDEPSSGPSTAPARPSQCAYVTQIILKDLRPLLCPLPATHYTTPLKEYKANAYATLTKDVAMWVWDPTGAMSRTYRMQACLDLAAAAVGDTASRPPVLGTPIRLPRCVKATGCNDAFGRALGRGGRSSSSTKIWAETKYDGERTQIHVRVDAIDGSSHVSIFSKSGRDSSLDRWGVHWIVREALGLSHRSVQDLSKIVCRKSLPAKQVTTDIILEAEMIAFSDTLGRIDEFWRIRSLVESTARGVRSNRKISCVELPEDQPDSQCSILSNASDASTRHLALVFFDILYLDGVSLLGEPYSARRALLESVVAPIPGRAMLASRTRVRNAIELRDHFAGLVAACEGCVLKAEASV